MRRSPRSYNENLEPLPSHQEIARAMLKFDGDAVRFGRRWYGEVSANALAGELGMVGARRLGRGAQGSHSWSGTMSASLRLTPRLKSMKLKGLVEIYYDRDSGRHIYSLTDEGSKLAESRSKPGTGQDGPQATPDNPRPTTGRRTP